MKTDVKMPTALGFLNVLLVGNNPIDMGKMLDKLNQIRTKRIITDIAFDIRTVMERLLHFNPHYILLDDNIGKIELNEMVKVLTNDKRTKDVPITVLKNSNYDESAVMSSMLDYMLKEVFSGESLLNALKNSVKFKRTQDYLLNSYNKRKETAV